MHLFICPDCQTNTKFRKTGVILRCSGCQQYFLAAHTEGLEEVFFRKISESTAKNYTFDSAAIFTFLQQFSTVRQHWLKLGRQCLDEKKYEQALAYFINIRTGDQGHVEANNLILTEYLRSQEYKLAVTQIELMNKNYVEFYNLNEVVAQIIVWAEKFYQENQELIDPLRIYARTKIAPLGYKERFLQEQIPAFAEVNFVLTHCLNLIDGVEVSLGERLSELMTIAESVC